MPSRPFLGLVTVACAVVLTGCSGADRGVDDGSSSATPSLPPIDVAGLSGRAKPLVDAVQPDRAFADITTLARTPRHPEQNPDDTRAAAAYIRSELTEAGLEPQDIPVVVGGTTLPVVWAEIAGRRCADKVFVVTGHYDTVAGTPGADDDASGVAAMLEIGRVLARAEPDASVVVAGLPFEEKGPPYPASRALGEQLRKQGRTIVGMISAEMMGYAAPKPTEDDAGNTLLLLGYEGAEGSSPRSMRRRRHGPPPARSGAGSRRGPIPRRPTSSVAPTISRSTIWGCRRRSRRTGRTSARRTTTSLRTPQPTSSARSSRGRCARWSAERLRWRRWTPTATGKRRRVWGVSPEAPAVDHRRPRRLPRQWLPSLGHVGAASIADRY